MKMVHYFIVSPHPLQGGFFLYVDILTVVYISSRRDIESCEQGQKKNRKKKVTR